MRSFKSLFFGLFFSIFFTPSIFALTVISDGEGLTCSKAVKVALRNAIQQAVGVNLYSETVVKNMQFFKNEIETYTRGMIKNYTILRKEKNKYSCYVEIKANVSDFKIQEFFSSPAVQNFFQKLCFHKRRVGVYYVKRTSEDLPFNSIPARSLIDLLQDRLSQYQFRVFISYLNPKEVQYKEDGQLAKEISKKDDVDVGILARITETKRKVGDFYEVSFIVSLKAYDANAGEFFAAVQKQITKPFYSLPSEGYLNRIAVKLGKIQALKLISKVVNRLENKGCKTTYIVILQNVNPKLINEVEDLLDDSQIDYNIRRETPNSAEYEIISDLSLKDLKKYLRKIFRKAKLNLFPVKVEEQTIVFEPF